VSNKLVRCRQGFEVAYLVFSEVVSITPSYMIFVNTMVILSKSVGCR